jgi:hypothetical protein
MLLYFRIEKCNFKHGYVVKIGSHLKGIYEIGILLYFAIQKLHITFKNSMLYGSRFICFKTKYKSVMDINEDTTVFLLII